MPLDHGVPQHQGQFVDEVAAHWHGHYPGEVRRPSGGGADRRPGDPADLPKGVLKPGAFHAIHLCAHAVGLWRWRPRRSTGSSRPRWTTSACWSVSIWCIRPRTRSTAAAPCGLVTAARKLRVVPRQVPGVGGRAGRVLAAKAANMACIAVPEEGEGVLPAFALAHLVVARWSRWTLTPRSREPEALVSRHPGDRTPHIDPFPGRSSTHMRAAVGSGPPIGGRGARHEVSLSLQGGRMRNLRRLVLALGGVGDGHGRYRCGVGIAPTCEEPPAPPRASVTVPRTGKPKPRRNAQGVRRARRRWVRSHPDSEEDLNSSAPSGHRKWAGINNQAGIERYRSGRGNLRRRHQPADYSVQPGTCGRHRTARFRPRHLPARAVALGGGWVNEGTVVTDSNGASDPLGTNGWRAYPQRVHSDIGIASHPLRGAAHQRQRFELVSVIRSAPPPRSQSHVRTAPGVGRWRSTTEQFAGEHRLTVRCRP